MRFSRDFLIVVVNVNYFSHARARVSKFVKHHPKESNSARQGLESRLRPARVACEQFIYRQHAVSRLLHPSCSGGVARSFNTYRHRCGIY